MTKMTIIKVALLSSAVFAGFWIRPAQQTSAHRVTSTSVQAAPTDRYGGNLYLSCSGGAKEGWYEEKIAGRWYFCTPLGNAYWMQGVFGVGWDDSVDFQGVNNKTYGSIKYANGPFGSGNWICNWGNAVLSSLRNWGFNAMGEYGIHWWYATDDSHPGCWGTRGDKPTPPLPYLTAMNAARGVEVYYAGGRAVKGWPDTIKLSVSNLSDMWYSFADGEDPFDPSYPAALDAQLAQFKADKGYNSDYFIGYIIGESDNMGLTRCGAFDPAIPAPSGFNDIRNRVDQGKYNNCAVSFGLFGLIASPLLTAGASNNGGKKVLVDDVIGGTTSPAYGDSKFYAKEAVVDYLQGKANVTAIESVTCDGSTAVIRFDGNPFIKGESVSIAGAAPARFNTAPGAPLVVAAYTPTTITVPLIGPCWSGGGTVASGPGYTLAALNRAWGSHYTQFQSAATAFSGEPVGTGDGTKTAFTATLKHVPVTPMSVQVTVNGKVWLGDDGLGPRSQPAASMGGLLGQAKMGDPIHTGSINYSTGKITIAFATPPPAGAIVAMNYSVGGWGAGSGLADEDGSCPSRGSAPCWFPTDMFAESGPNVTSAFVADLDRILFHIAKQYFSVVQSRVKKWNPTALYLGPTGMGTSCAPPRAPILMAASAYLDALSFNTIPCGALDDQARVDFIVRYTQDRPWIEWESVIANPDSYVANAPSRNDGGTYKSQSERGVQYAKMVDRLLNARSSIDNTAHIAGFRWWSLLDSRSEGVNFGLLTRRANAYDGREAGAATLSCSPPNSMYSCGGETSNYGDFLGAVKTANLAWRAVPSGGGSPPAPATR